ncbi:MAG: hypothetical protein GX757_12920 [Clostridiales bacterium]|nr:hypothetical protein [Clostridiales bacterium]
MKKQKLVSFLLIFDMLFSTVVSHIPVSLSLLYHKITKVPSASNAVLSLSNIQDKRIILDGEWEFYWSRLLISDPDPEEVGDHFYIRVPGYWTKLQLNGKYLPADGFASYRLILKDIPLISRSQSIFLISEVLIRFLSTVSSLLKVVLFRKPLLMYTPPPE